MRHPLSSNYIFVGIGHAGGKILCNLKQRFHEEVISENEYKENPVSFLYIDSSDDLISKDDSNASGWGMHTEETCLNADEFLNIAVVDWEAVLNDSDAYPYLQNIIDDKFSVRLAVDGFQKEAGEKRRIGRLRFAVHATAFVDKLREAQEHCSLRSGSSATDIYFLVDLADGLSSGAMIDVMHQASKAFPASGIFLYAVMPEVNSSEPESVMEYRYRNAYAALTELNALQMEQWNPWDVTGAGRLSLYNHEISRVHRIQLFSNQPEKGDRVLSMPELYRAVSDIIFYSVSFGDPCFQDGSIHGIWARIMECRSQCYLGFENDEYPASGSCERMIRTKELGSLGLKRILYPQKRILRFLAFSVGLGVLRQLLYNHWEEGQGFVSARRDTDSCKRYLSESRMSFGIFDRKHLTLETHILDSEDCYPGFKDYWQEKVCDGAEEAKSSDNPFCRLDELLSEAYDCHFRNSGVELYFQYQKKRIPEMIFQVCNTVRHELLCMWMDREFGLMEIQEVVSLLLEKLTVLRTTLEASAQQEKKRNEEKERERLSCLKEQAEQGIISRISKGRKLFERYKNVLEDLYVCRTEIVALAFAEELMKHLILEIQNLSASFSSFCQNVLNIYLATENKVTACAGMTTEFENIGDSCWAELYDEEKVDAFVQEMLRDRLFQFGKAEILRKMFVTENEYNRFKELPEEKDMERILTDFWRQLSESVKEQDFMRPYSEGSLLDVNILSLLSQRLKTDEEIETFAGKWLEHQGPLLQLDSDQVNLHLNNNDSPVPGENIDRRVVFIGIPFYEDNIHLREFAEKLKKAFLKTLSKMRDRIAIEIFYDKSSRNDLYLLSACYCFPMRAIASVASYHTSYYNCTHTRVPEENHLNACLLHSEGDGTEFPSIVIRDVAELAFRLFFAEDNQQYGPYQYDECRELVRDGRLTLDSLVWFEGLNSWERAGLLSGLEDLFLKQLTGDILSSLQKAAEQDFSIQVFIARNNRHYGPYSYDQCREGVKDGWLTQDSLVWFEGLNSWEHAHMLTSLQSMFV